MTINPINIMGMDEIETFNTSVDDIDNENVNLIFVGIDESYSMNMFIPDMKEALVDFKLALANSKEVDEILVARADFSDYADIKGYKKVSEFDTVYQVTGGTALYDVIMEGTDKLLNYMTYLKQQGVRVKAVFAIFSDGDDTCSKHKLADAKAKIKLLNDKEIITAFIGFGGTAYGIADKLGFRNKLNVGSTASELRRAFNCLSKSVIANSKSIVNKVDDFMVD